MNSISAGRNLSNSIWVPIALVFAGLLMTEPHEAQQSTATTTATAQVATKPNPNSVLTRAKTFDTPQQAADALVQAATKFDVDALEDIFGPQGDDIVLTGEFPQDRQRALDFAAEAREKKTVSVDSMNANRAFLIVGDED